MSHSQRDVEQQVKKAINSNYVKIINKMDPEPVINYLRQSVLVVAGCESYYEELRNKLKKRYDTKADVNERLIEILYTRERWWIPLIKALRQGGDNSQVADIIEGKQWKDELKIQIQISMAELRSPLSVQINILSDIPAVLPRSEKRKLRQTGERSRSERSHMSRRQEVATSVTVSYDSDSDHSSLNYVENGVARDTSGFHSQQTRRNHTTRHHIDNRYFPREDLESAPDERGTPYLNSFPSGGNNRDLLPVGGNRSHDPLQSGGNRHDPLPSGTSLNHDHGGPSSGPLHGSYFSNDDARSPLPVDPGLSRSSSTPSGPASATIQHSQGQPSLSSQRHLGNEHHDASQLYNDLPDEAEHPLTNQNLNDRPPEMPSSDVQNPQVGSPEHNDASQISPDPPLTPDTHIIFVPAAVLHKLHDQLDRHNNWKIFGGKLTNKFTYDNEDRIANKEGSKTEQVIDFYKKAEGANAKIGKVLKVLKDMQRRDLLDEIEKMTGLHLQEEEEKPGEEDLEVDLEFESPGVLPGALPSRTSGDSGSCLTGEASTPEATAVEDSENPNTDTGRDSPSCPAGEHGPVQETESSDSIRPVDERILLSQREEERKFENAINRETEELESDQSKHSEDTQQQNANSESDISEENNLLQDEATGVQSQLNTVEANQCENISKPETMSKVIKSEEMRETQRTNDDDDDGHDNNIVNTNHHPPDDDTIHRPPINDADLFGPPIDLPNTALSTHENHFPPRTMQNNAHVQNPEMIIQQPYHGMRPTVQPIPVGPYQDILYSNPVMQQPYQPMPMMIPVAQPPPPGYNNPSLGCPPPAMGYAQVNLGGVRMPFQGYPPGQIMGYPPGQIMGHVANPNTPQSPPQQTEGNVPLLHLLGMESSVQHPSEIQQEQTAPKIYMSAESTIGSNAGPEESGNKSMSQQSSEIQQEHTTPKMYKSVDSTVSTSAESGSIAMSEQPSQVPSCNRILPHPTRQHQPQPEQQPQTLRETSGDSFVLSSSVFQEFQVQNPTWPSMSEASLPPSIHEQQAKHVLKQSMSQTESQKRSHEENEESRQGASGGRPMSSTGQNGPADEPAEDAGNPGIPGEETATATAGGPEEETETISSIARNVFKKAFTAWEYVSFGADPNKFIRKWRST